MGVAIARQLSGYRAAVLLGWAVSSNWTRPVLFIVYSVLRPISMALILAVMYTVITGNAAATRPYLAFLIIGTAFWSFIQEGVSEFATGILEDRGRYHILKYSYMAPLGFPIFLVGRATSKLASAADTAGLCNELLLVVGIEEAGPGGSGSRASAGEPDAITRRPRST